VPPRLHDGCEEETEKDFAASADFASLPRKREAPREAPTPTIPIPISVRNVFLIRRPDDCTLAMADSDSVRNTCSTDNSWSFGMPAQQRERRRHWVSVTDVAPRYWARLRIEAAGRPRRALGMRVPADLSVVASDEIQAASAQCGCRSLPDPLS
jgi:hypothetical protein